MEERRVRGGPIEHGPTIAYSLRDVELIDGWIYSRSMRAKAAHAKQHIFVSPALETLKQAALASSLPGNTYFGHWLTDDLLLHQAAKSLGVPVMVERGVTYGHEAGYCDLLTINQRKLSRAHFKELIVFEDRGQNAFKRQRYQDLRNALRKAVPGSGAEKVYIRRGIKNANAGRHLINAPEVEAFLESQGFLIVDPDTLSAKELAKSTMNAKIVVGVEGSHMNHGIMPLADEGTIWCLQPPYRFNNVFKDIADSIYANYAFVIGVEVEGGFKVLLDDMKQMLDRLQAPHPVHV